MSNAIVVKKGTAETCPNPQCGASKMQIHRNPYRFIEVGGLQARPVYTCTACEQVYVEDPREAASAQTVAVLPPPADTRPVVVRMPGADAPKPAAIPLTPPQIAKISRSTLELPSVAKVADSPAEQMTSTGPVRVVSQATEERALPDDRATCQLMLKVAREDLERIAGELGLSIDANTISVSADIIAEIRAIRNATGLRAAASTARALMNYMDKHGLHIDETDMSSAQKKHGTRLTNNLREALRLK